MNKAENILRLNFSAFDNSWMLNYAYTQLIDGWKVTPWKKEIFYFIIDWFSDSDTIKVTTSGSTGTPKAISLNKKHIIKSAEATNRFFKMHKGKKALLCLPTKYIAGKMMIVRALVGKYNLYAVEPSLTPLFDETSLDFAAMTPAQVGTLLKSGQGNTLLNNIDKLIIGGSEIPVSLEQKLLSIKTNIWHTYGMTETITHIALRKVNGINPEPAFYPMEQVALSQKNQQLVIDAPDIGVHQLITNDLVEFTENGGFRVLGRKDNVVISGGIKLFPEIIEKKLAGICKKPFYFSGKKDEHLGTKLVMYIESSEAVNCEELKRQIDLKVDKYESPKEIIVQKSFKRTVSGKIIRNK